MRLKIILTAILINVHSVIINVIVYFLSEGIAVNYSMSDKKI